MSKRNWLENWLGGESFRPQSTSPGVRTTHAPRDPKVDEFFRQYQSILGDIVHEWDGVIRSSLQNLGARAFGKNGFASKSYRVSGGVSILRNLQTTGGSSRLQHLDQLRSAHWWKVRQEDLAITQQPRRDNGIEFGILLFADIPSPWHRGFAEDTLGLGREHFSLSAWADPNTRVPVKGLTQQKLVQFIEELYSSGPNRTMSRKEREHLDSMYGCG